MIAPDGFETVVDCKVRNTNPIVPQCFLDLQGYVRPGGEVTNGGCVDLKTPQELVETGYLWDNLVLLFLHVHVTIGVSLTQLDEVSGIEGPVVYLLEVFDIDGTESFMDFEKGSFFSIVFERYTGSALTLRVRGRARVRAR